MYAYYTVEKDNTMWLNRSDFGDNASTATAVGFPYDSLEELYEHQLPTIMTLNRYFTAVWYAQCSVTFLHRSILIIFIPS